MAFTKHIFLATDFSEASEAAVDAAAELARAHGAEITLFHVFDPEPLIPPGAVPNPKTFAEKITSEMEGAVRAKLEEIRDQKLAGLDVTVLVAADDSAAESICKNAEKVGADLVVISTHGRTGIRRFFIGSVAEKVVRHAHTKVLAVRPGAR